MTYTQELKNISYHLQIINSLVVNIIKNREIEHFTR